MKSSKQAKLRKALKLPKTLRTHQRIPTAAKVNGTGIVKPMQPLESRSLYVTSYDRGLRILNRST